MKKILDIGCGKNKYQSLENKVIGMDIVDLPGVDIVHDLKVSPFPFNNDEFDIIIAKHILEHLNNIVEIMAELYRILKPNGLLNIIIPYFSSPSAFKDPTHVRYFTLNTFDYFLEDSEYCYYFKKKIKFKLICRRFIPYNTFFSRMVFSVINKHQVLYESLISRIIPPKELEIILKKSIE